MRFLILSSIALLGAWLTQPLLQVEHEPVVSKPGDTATVTVKDDQPAQKPTTTGGKTMR